MKFMTNCCCCFDLRKGCAIFGVLAILFYIFVGGVTSFLLYVLLSQDGTRHVRFPIVLTSYVLYISISVLAIVCLIMMIYGAIYVS